MNRPTDHLTFASRSYPQGWKHIDAFRASRGLDLPKWPGWCFLPISGWYAIVSEKYGGIVPPEHGLDVGRLAALGTWRYSQGIYRFDPDLFNHLWETGISGDLPSDVLLRLPEWCLYIETPGKKYFNNDLYGFFVHLEWDVKDHRHELRLVLDLKDKLLPQPLHIGEWPLSSAIQKMVNEATHHIPMGTMIEVPNKNQYQSYQELLAPLVNLVLYICSDKPDFGPQQRPQRPRPTRTKKGWKLFPAKKSTIWHIGEIIGKQIREFNAGTVSENTGRTVRPHLRRAHWHGYWTGPKAGPRRFRYHWLPPMLIHEREEPP